MNVDNGALYDRELPTDPDRKCEADAGSCWLLSPGTYSILGIVNTLRPDVTDDWVGRSDVVNQSFVGYPQMEVARDTAVVLDARKAVRYESRRPTMSSDATGAPLRRSSIQGRRLTARGTPRPDSRAAEPRKATTCSRPPR
ncbi:hypothetical protein [Nonomuraea sp. bgisy101]|uniref:hypothetical protein n=1 Tax=Nonomuraea sp. bgisy101 TaxID=3413784 RepID=UPI003D74AC79